MIDEINQRPQSPLVSLAISVTAIFIACGGLFLIGVAAAYAQPRDSSRPPQRAEDSAELAKTLKLSAAQSTSVTAIIQQDRDAQQKLREEMRAKRDALDALTRSKLGKVLNTEQMGRYQEWRESNRPARPDGPLRGDESPMKRRQ